MNLEALLHPVNVEGTPCIVVKTIDSLPQDYQKAVKELMETESAEQMAVRFKAAGLPGRASSFQRHKAGTCSCPIIKEETK